MNRPYLVNFSAINSDARIYIKATITSSDTSLLSNPNVRTKASSPIQSIKLFNKNLFTINIKGLSENNEVIFDKEYDTGSYGNFDLEISEKSQGKIIAKFIIFENRTFPGVSVHLGSVIPTKIKDPKKIIISDFDKTLVDTKYSSLKEVYYSLNRPLNYFPTVASSLEILQENIENGHQPFILSASPHFYENAIRDWLYQNQVFTNSILLKDYRHFISLFEGELSTKDLKKHGFYKLNQLVNILSMTGIPDELVLMGDGFESDPFIYLTLHALIVDRVDPWQLWKSIKNHNIFNLTNKQDAYFLTKFYRISDQSKLKEKIKMKIYIRATEHNMDSLKTRLFENHYVQNASKSIEYYLG